MSRHLPIYLHTIRKRWGLSQRELALLFKTTQANLCRYESLDRRPSIVILLGAEIIFGARIRDVFPAFYGEIEEKIMCQAKILYERLDGREDFTSVEKLRLLQEMLGRISPDPSTL